MCLLNLDRQGGGALRHNAVSCLSVAMPNPIIVALDVSAERASKLVEDLAPVVGAFKIGSTLFTNAGPDFVRKVRATGASVFLDLKFHDIPNTVSGAVASATALDVQMITIHTCGGVEMMKAAEDAAQNTARELNRPAPLILGVTVLTSMDDATLREIGLPASAEQQVVHLAQLAAKAGLRGLVCSPLEVTKLRSFIPKTMQLVTPGIRTGSEKADDQKRTMSPKEALAAGANWLVIGRPIYAASNPKQATEIILAGD
jgi:orotidine-5'-phosphate decarboxylase